MLTIFTRISLPDAWVEALGVVRAVSTDIGDDFVRTNLVEQAWQHRRIAGGIVRHLNGTDFQGRGVYAQMHLAPLPTVVRAMLLRFPFTFAQHLDAGTVDQQVQPCRRCVRRNLHGKILLAAAVRQDIFDYIEMFYNPKCRHGFNDRLSPVEFERRHFERLASV